MFSLLGFIEIKPLREICSFVILLSYYQSTSLLYIRLDISVQEISSGDGKENNVLIL
jgi:hypothetical protein